MILDAPRRLKGHQEADQRHTKICQVSSLPYTQLYAFITSRIKRLRILELKQSSFSGVTSWLLQWLTLIIVAKVTTELRIIIATRIWRSVHDGDDALFKTFKSPFALAGAYGRLVTYRIGSTRRPGIPQTRTELASSVHVPARSPFSINDPSHPRNLLDAVKVVLQLRASACNLIVIMW